MKQNVIEDKSFAFAIRSVKMYKHLNEKKKEYVIAKQLLRCGTSGGTSVGALVREAEHAESTADFVHTIAIAQKEINETIYWIELLYATDFITAKQLASINDDAVELIKIITSIIKTSKANKNSGSLINN